MTLEVNRGRTVLTLSSESATRQHLATLLADLGYAATGVTRVDEALTELARGEFALTMLDLGGDGNQGSELLRRLRVQGGEPGAVIVVTNGHGIEQTAEAAALGAADILPRPFTPEDLENTIKSALARPRRRWWRPAEDDSVARLREELGLWRSPRMQGVRRIIDQAARIDVTVLIGGETGVGKDVVARAIHALSLRQERPFVKVNCAAVPRDLLESELFGHERGAFTGADRQKIGKFEAADQGTIFLDEIGDLHPDLQGKLLHVLQDGQFSRVGGRSTVKVNVRVLAATNQSLEQAVAAGRFREDLFYRLNVIQIVVPPLRDRREDIAPLTEFFVRRYSELFHRPLFELRPDALDRLLHHRFPGNVRELENMVKRMIVLGDVDRSEPVAEIPLDTRAVLSGKPTRTPAISLKDISRRAAQEAERQEIVKMLEHTRWNRVKAAKLLNISYRALLYKIKDAGLDRRSPSAGLTS
jgi:two-component system response regulator AtoC